MKRTLPPAEVGDNDTSQKRPKAGAAKQLPLPELYEDEITQLHQSWKREQPGSPIAKYPPLARPQRILGLPRRLTKVTPKGMDNPDTLTRFEEWDDEQYASQWELKWKSVFSSTLVDYTTCKNCTRSSINIRQERFLYAFSKDNMSLQELIDNELFNSEIQDFECQCLTRGRLKRTTIKDVPEVLFVVHQFYHHDKSGTKKVSKLTFQDFLKRDEGQFVPYIFAFALEPEESVPRHGPQMEIRNGNPGTPSAVNNVQGNEGHLDYPQTSTPVKAPQTGRSAFEEQQMGLMKQLLSELGVKKEYQQLEEKYKISEEQIAAHKEELGEAAIALSAAVQSKEIFKQALKISLEDTGDHQSNFKSPVFDTRKPTEAAANQARQRAREEFTGLINTLSMTNPKRQRIESALAEANDEARSIETDSRPARSNPESSRERTPNTDSPGSQPAQDQASRPSPAVSSQGSLPPTSKANKSVRQTAPPKKKAAAKKKVDTGNEGPKTRKGTKSIPAPSGRALRSKKKE
ncbi:hypothetical protein UCRPC4_g00360 [Phaeomoniella chlamydospora]|uniref:Uncharacterized protein n=1 Tax=Phaeomoniella chlamydospora TaxID=158046 RepID=A0A0G2F3K6_PHACM|nr:hypothetical protein UCRPC4_g00360 [Phaeomoniella chlamydospora]